MLDELRQELRNYATPEKAKASSRFFKTGEGQYGYGDKFLGVTVPQLRAIAKKYKGLSLPDLEKLLSSQFHEERLVALFILVFQFQKGSEERKKEIFDFYIANLKFVNNWDLVDSSADKIVGEYLLDKKISLLLHYAKCENLWEKRVGMIATFAFIKKGDPKPTFAVADLLLDDRADLIQKAVGWMLREVGKRIGEDVLVDYLKARYKKLGRTALRYAIERMSKEKRAMYLAGTV